MIHNGVTSRILSGAVHRFGGTAVLSSSCVPLAPQRTLPTLNQKPEHCSGYTYFVGPKQAGQGSALPCLSEGHYVLIFHCELEALREVKSMRNQHDKEKRNPPTSNRGVTRLGSNPCNLSGDA